MTNCSIEMKGLKFEEMNAARTALRMGAKSVSILYHRTCDEMPALKTEYHEAVSEGVNFFGRHQV